jgi:hypothetical protein
VEEAPDEGEPERQERKKVHFQEWAEVITSEGERQRRSIPREPDPPTMNPKRAAQRRRRRQEKRFDHRKLTALTNGPRWTMAPPHSRAIPIPDVAITLKHLEPVAARAGSRRVQQRQARRSRWNQQPSELADGEIKEDTNIELLSATNFLFLARQKGVKVMRTTFEALEEAAKKKPDATSRLPQLPESFFEGILKRQGAAADYLKQLPDDFHEFIDAIWTDHDTVRKIDEMDADKFFAKSNKPQLTADDIIKRLPKEYHDLVDAFMPQDADKLPPHRSYDHKIEIIPGSKLPFARNRPLSPMELRVLKRWLDDNLRKGFIRPSKSSVSSPILLAKKPGGGVRICVDYRGINNATMKSRYPIPLIRETLDSICKAKIFTKLDVIAAFNRVRVTEGHEWLTAFITRFGLYESLVTPFGLQGAPATFQHYINDLLYDALDKWATAYLDDILIYSANEKEHVQQVREVLRRLIDAGLQIDIDKCEFHTKKTKYLGLIITPGGIEMDPEKVAAITSWLPPTTRRHLQRFLGFANFYRRFISDFAGVARPLYDLTKKTAEWNWTDRCQEAFERLKRCFAMAPALKIYDWEKPAVVETDSSDWSAGGTLLQEGDDGEVHPVAYFSAKHSAQECNYDIYDKELLAIIKALEEWRPELEGACQRFDIITDHKNLQTFATTKQLSPRHMRWSEFLSRFNFRIVYRPGAANARPDALSRKPEDMPSDVKDDRLRNRKKALIDPSCFDPVTFPEAEDLRLFQLDTTRHIDDILTDMYSRSAMLQEVMMALTDPEIREWPKQLRKQLRIPFAECRTVAGKAYYRDRLMIDPDDSNVQLQLIHRTHASSPGGHPGRVKTIDLMNRRY